MNDHRLPALVLVAGLAGCGPAATPSADSAATPAPPASSADASWPMYGRDVGRTGCNAGEVSIAADRVSRLAPLFTVEVGIGDLPSSSAPVVAAGRVCVGSSVATGDNLFCF